MSSSHPSLILHVYIWTDSSIKLKIVMSISHIIIMVNIVKNSIVFSDQMFQSYHFLSIIISYHWTDDKIIVQ